jgi:hypothetical protein
MFKLSFSKTFGWCGYVILIMQASKVDCRCRRSPNASVSAVTTLLEYNPSGGMWQATGTAIAHAPNATEIVGAVALRIIASLILSWVLTRRTPRPCTSKKTSEHNITNEDHIAPKVSFTNASKKAAIAAWRFILTLGWCGYVILIMQASKVDRRCRRSPNYRIANFILGGRTLCSASVSAVTTLLEYNPSGGMWQATGTAIAMSGP